MLAQDRTAPAETLWVQTSLDQLLLCERGLSAQRKPWQGQPIGTSGKGAGLAHFALRRLQERILRRKGTALWGSRMAEGKAEAIAQHLQEGCGIRQTARLVGASKDGVTCGGYTGWGYMPSGSRSASEGPGSQGGTTGREVVFVQKKEKHCDPRTG